MKYKIVIFGTGESAKKVVNTIQHNNVEICMYADNDFNKHGKIHNGVIIVNPRELKNAEYDYIIISNIKYAEVKKQLLGLEIEEDKLISYFDMETIQHPYFSQLFDGVRFLNDNYALQIKKINVLISNMPYETVKSKVYIPKVKSINETIDMLLDRNISISRFGDGEIKLIAGKDIGFQKTSLELIKRLKEVLWETTENHITGILDVFGDLSEYTDNLQNYFRTYLYEYGREFQYSLLNDKKEYYNSFITRPYISYKDRSASGEVFEKFMRLWENKNILIIEGDRTRLGRGNDLFVKAKKCRRIICPNENAFEKYDEILETVVNSVNSDELILAALGPTATILAFDLAKKGYTTLDIGHIDLEYEWYRMGAKDKVIVKNKYTNEVFGGNDNQEYIDEEYEKEIIARIDG